MGWENWHKIREGQLKLHLKKGFLLAKHLEAADKTSKDYVWHLIAADETGTEIHHEYTNLPFTETVSRINDMIGRRCEGKKIIQVTLFGDPENATLAYRSKFEKNAGTLRLTGIYRLVFN
jgi:hypothetical protein